MTVRRLAVAAAMFALVAASTPLAAQVAPSLPAATAPMPEALRMPTYRLWPGRAPGATADTPDQIPTLTVLRPLGPGNGTAVVVAPGGGYVALATTLEGLEPAAFLTARGVTAFILTYRVGATARLPIPFADGARAIRYVRANAAAFGIDPHRIGMMGFSAGGHLAATTAVDATAGEPASPDPVERASSRPDFLILGYPWLEGMQLRPDGGSPYCDFAGQRGGGAPCRPADYARFLPVAHVSAATPPTFLYHTTSDELVPVGGSVRFYQALVDHGVPAEMHLFQTGPHGTGLGGRSATLSHWPDLLDGWLRERGLLPPPAPR